MEAFIIVALMIGIGWWLLASAIRVYNSINPLRHGTDEAEANIEVSMQKRINLANNLLDVAERYAGHEKMIHLRIADQMSNIGGRREPVYVQTKNAMTIVAAMAARYPALKADQTYTRLMDDYSRLESDLQVKYEQYNSNARSYNALRASFPAILFVDLFGFKPVKYLDPSMWHPRR
ncbi:MAG TPA: LemA family protein [Fimbriimonas sp.]|nr:LemA family protein [Fimbriimonas sp.]